ncbi:MAG: NAD(P)-dependent oxidoreductase [Chloroflexi bacterium]|nr:NAD(P)-dependent oxidoreductase [Chloroflexota bacterium]
MRTLVTGGNGRVGLYVLRELLAAGHEPVCYSHTPPLEPRAGFMQGDIMDLERLRWASQGMEAIIHLAAVPGPGRTTPQRHLEVNVIGTVHVLEAAVAQGVRKVIFGSSGAALGFSFQRQRLVPRYFPVDDAHPAEPQDEYGLSKLLAELTCKRYSDACGLQTIALRINHVWLFDRPGAELAVCSGKTPYTDLDGLWSAYRRYIEDRDETEWPQPGPPSPRHNLWAVTDARDTAQAFRLALENETIRHDVFLINGDESSALTLSRELAARHYPETPLQAPLEGFAPLISSARARQALGYAPRHSWRHSDFAAWLAG